MKSRIMFYVAVAALGVTSLIAAQVQTIPTEPTKDSRAQEEDVRILMQAKLTNAHQVLQGLVTQDFDVIEQAAADLSRISLTPPPKSERGEDPSRQAIYEHFWLDFGRLAGQLERHARNHELEATAYVQQNMQATCIACHDYIRDNP